MTLRDGMIKNGMIKMFFPLNCFDCIFFYYDEYPGEYSITICELIDYPVDPIHKQYCILSKFWNRF